VAGSLPSVNFGDDYIRLEFRRRGIKDDPHLSIRGVPGVGVELTLLRKDPVFIGVAAPARHPIGTERYYIRRKERISVW